MISDLSERKGGWVRKNKIAVNDSHDMMAWLCMVVDNNMYGLIILLT